VCLKKINLLEISYLSQYRVKLGRNYSDEKIVELIYSPEPKNWPEYATPMAPMPQVPKDEALKIAAWINSLD